MMRWNLRSSSLFDASSQRWGNCMRGKGQGLVVPGPIPPNRANLSSYSSQPVIRTT